MEEETRKGERWREKTKEEKPKKGGTERGRSDWYPRPFNLVSPPQPPCSPPRD